METLSTQRLIMRACQTEDAAFVLQLLNSPGWLQYIGDRNVRTEEAAALYIEQRMRPSYEKYDHGMFLVLLKESETPIGLCGIVVRDTLPHPDIGFAFLPEFQGQGYAFEAASEMMQFVIGYTDIDVLLAIATPDNTSSIKLLEKLGMTYEETIVDPETKDTLVRYRIDL
jgi:RimJ/RimL family protein N-acetyltransferase